MARVVLERVSKRFGDVLAVRDLTLEIEDREFLVLVGPSGCGKTTALRMIAGLEDVTEGRISIGDQCVNGVSPKDRDVAMVFQSYALYPHMTVHDNLAFGLKLRRRPRADVERRVREVADALGLEELLTRKPKQLSGGQRQRVALGRAIVREPRVFLMDEPLSNLDAQLRVQTRAELIKLHQRLQTTTIYVTHDQVEAMTMGHRIAVMRDGVLHQLDTPRQIYDHPVNMFVAGFIGSPSMNFLRGRLVRDAGTLAFETEAARFPLPGRDGPGVAGWVDQDVVLGIRPEHIRPRPDPGAPADGPFTSAPISVVEPLGSEVYVFLQVGQQELLARMEARADLRPGARVEFLLQPDRAHFFNPATTQALPF